MRKFLVSHEAAIASFGSDSFAFLGGTVNSAWREALAPLVSVPTFNPIVAEWNAEAQAQEVAAKAVAAVEVYVITPAHTGFYSFVEMTVSALTGQGKKVALLFLESDTEGRFTEPQRKSNCAICELLSSTCGVDCLETLQALADYLNGYLKPLTEANVSDSSPSQ